MESIAYLSVKLPTDVMPALRERGMLSKIAASAGISRQAVAQWRIVPVQHVLLIEQLTDISRHVIRPDIYPEERNHKKRKRA